MGYAELKNELLEKLQGNQLDEARKFAESHLPNPIGFLLLFNYHAFLAEYDAANKKEHMQDAFRDLAIVNKQCQVFMQNSSLLQLKQDASSANRVLSNYCRKLEVSFSTKEMLILATQADMVLAEIKKNHPVVKIEYEFPSPP